MVLDEADQMLNVGFEKDVETILENVPEVGTARIRLTAVLFALLVPI